MGFHNFHHIYILRTRFVFFLVLCKLFQITIHINFYVTFNHISNKFSIFIDQNSENFHFSQNNTLKITSCCPSSTCRCSSSWSSWVRWRWSCPCEGCGDSRTWTRCWGWVWGLAWPGVSLTPSGPTDRAGVGPELVTHQLTRDRGPQRVEGGRVVGVGQAEDTGGSHLPGTGHRHDYHAGGDDQTWNMSQTCEPGSCFFWSCVNFCQTSVWPIGGDVPHWVAKSRIEIKHFCRLGPQGGGFGPSPRSHFLFLLFSEMS